MSTTSTPPLTRLHCEIVLRNVALSQGAAARGKGKKKAKRHLIFKVYVNGGTTGSCYGKKVLNSNYVKHQPHVGYAVCPYVRRIRAKPSFTPNCTTTTIKRYGRYATSYLLMSTVLATASYVGNNINGKRLCLERATAKGNGTA